MTTPPPDNPWKKRKQGPKEFMPPSRALLVEYPDGRKATATWVSNPDGSWQCASTSRGLGWMWGLTVSQREGFAAVRNKLAMDGVRWHWIEPNTAQALRPPF